VNCCCLFNWRPAVTRIELGSVRKIRVCRRNAQKPTCAALGAANDAHTCPINDFEGAPGILTWGEMDVQAAGRGIGEPREETIQVAK
jgi:hypothetical protein